MTFNYVKPPAFASGFSLFFHEIHHFLHKNVLFTECSLFFQNSFKNSVSPCGILYSQARSNQKILSFPYSLLMQNPLPGRQNRAADDANIDHTVPPVCFPAARLGGSFLFPPFGAKNRTAFVKLPGFLWFRCNHAQRARCKMASPFMISSLVMVRGGSRRRVSLPAVSTRRPSSMHFCASSLWLIP